MYFWMAHHNVPQKKCKGSCGFPQSPCTWAVSVKSDNGRIECLPRLYSNNADSEIVLGIGVASFILFYIRSVHSREARLVGSARLSSLRCLRFSLARLSSGTDPDGFGSG